MRKKNSVDDTHVSRYDDHSCSYNHTRTQKSGQNSSRNRQESINAHPLWTYATANDIAVVSTAFR